MCLYTGIALAQPLQDTSRRVKWLAVPVLFKSPELGIGYGASASALFKTSFWADSLTRLSYINSTAFFTTRKQNVQSVDALIFFPKEKNILFLQALHSYFPDRFWGIGPETKNENEENYAFNQLYLKAQLRKKIHKGFFAMAGLEMRKLLGISYRENGIFSNSIFDGRQPYFAAGLGGGLSYDSRNNANWPTRGVFVYSNATFFLKQLGSDYPLTKWQTDVRLFKPINKITVLAFQFFSYQTFGRVPFREMAVLGGVNNMRGFYQGRFRDLNMYSAIGEYRILFYNSFGACLFAGLGSVYNNPNQLLATNIKYSFGAGLRYSLLKREKLNLRLDYGFSDKYNQGLYFTIGECF